MSSIKKEIACSVCGTLFEPEWFTQTRVYRDGRFVLQKHEPRLATTECAECHSPRGKLQDWIFAFLTDDLDDKAQLPRTKRGWRFGLTNRGLQIGIEIRNRACKQFGVDPKETDRHVRQRMIVDLQEWLSLQTGEAYDETPRLAVVDVLGLLEGRKSTHASPPRDNQVQDRLLSIEQYAQVLERKAKTLRTWGNLPVPKVVGRGKGSPNLYAECDLKDWVRGRRPNIYAWKYGSPTDEGVQ